MTADNKYIDDNMQKFGQEIQTPLSLKEKTFSGFFIAFWNVHEIWNILKPQMSILA